MRNMYEWVAQTIASKEKKALPVLSFPAIQKLNISVQDIVKDSDKQAEGIKLIADHFDTAAAVSYMDLSVEAEAFGSEIRYSENEVPTVVGHIIESMEEAEALKVPEIGAGRTGSNIEAMKKAASLITDRPLFAGIIGPFSLAGRLLDVTEAMMYCFDEP
ncbi:MAG: methyltransferase, partial [Lachnospiraceae bacterium]|nr:methyltransferase [Lachnospiraceae bacterium]